MTSNLYQQAREALTQQAHEALLRALPHLSPRRRELLTSWLMGEPLTSSAWYDGDVEEYWALLTFIPRLIMFGAPYTMSRANLKADVIARINQVINDIESRNPGS